MQVASSDYKHTIGVRCVSLDGKHALKRAGIGHRTL